MLKKNTVLTSLGIAYTGIDESGGKLLLEALEVNTKCV